MDLYTQDSFFALTVAGRMGLLVLSALLAAVTAAMCWWIAKGRRGPVRLFVGFAGFMAFVSLSPQTYYLYYMLLFENLPLQWVTRMPQGTELFSLLTFTGPANLSAHSQGALGWLLMGLSWRSPGSGDKP